MGMSEASSGRISVVSTCIDLSFDMVNDVVGSSGH
jgi:hypothetical protein